MNIAQHYLAVACALTMPEDIAIPKWITRMDGWTTTDYVADSKCEVASIEQPKFTKKITISLILNLVYTFNHSNRTANRLKCKNKILLLYYILRHPQTTSVSDQDSYNWSLRMLLFSEFCSLF